MNQFSQEELKDLLEEREGPCVSMFMPTYVVGPETQQNPIRFSNLMREAENQLHAYGLSPQAAKQLLEPIASLEADREFWEHQGEGLAIFVAPNFHQTVRVPIELEELVVVADLFHVKPLLPLLSNDGRFYVLAISQNDVRLLEGSHYEVHEVELEDVPTSLAEALRFDQMEEHIQFHSSNPAKRADIFHGQGVGSTEEQNKERILQYFQKLDAGLHEYLAGDTAPLVLAGVEYLHAIYRQANRYPHLVEDGITGNPDDVSAEELHEEAWSIVEPLFLKTREDAATRYKELAGNNPARVSEELEDILPAAYYGRVDTLFVVPGEHRWGTFDPESTNVEAHEAPQNGDVDLLDFAALHTLLNSGTVYAVGEEEMPASSPISAIFRY